MEILIIIVLIIFLLVFILVPFIMLLQCIFDSEVTGTVKLIVFLASLLLFPLPSFCYGAFIKNGLFSKIMIGLYLLFVMVALAAVFLFGGFAVFETLAKREGQAWPTAIEKPVEEEKDTTYKGHNDYELDSVNVFRSGREK